MFLSDSYLKDDERILSSGRENLVTQVEEGFRTFGLKTKSSLRLDYHREQGLYTSGTESEAKSKLGTVSQSQE
jgi:hypothetical protein